MDDYGEDIDWDVIYRAFHAPARVARRVVHSLHDVAAPVLYCGFAEVAAHLAVDRSVELVDRSPTIADRSAARYPTIARVVCSDIADRLGSEPAKTVVIGCRLSAFWQSRGALQRIADALLAHPRDQVLIDFFDRDAVNEGTQIDYASPAGAGSWRFENFDATLPGAPLIHLAAIQVRYSLPAVQTSYLARRAFFRQSTLAAWCRTVFVNYTVSIRGPLLDRDPSFLVDLRPK